MRRALLALALWLAGCKDQSPSEAVHNQCFDQDGCGKDPRQVVCDRALLKCLRPKTSEPYPLFLRVTPANPNVLTDAGIELVPQYVEELGPLMGQRDAEVLHVPATVTVPGSVFNPTDGGMQLVPAQVVFSTSDAMIPVPPIVIETAPGIARDGGAPQLQAQLDPQRHYDVRAQPLWASSAVLPPISKEDVGTDGTIDLKYEEPKIVPRSGRFIYRDSVRPDYVRLQERTTGRVLSSTTRVSDDTKIGPDGEKRFEGTFTLYAQSPVFDGSIAFDLVLGIADFDPWQVTIAIDGARFLSGADMVLPPVPKPVTASNWVEDRNAKRLPHSQLKFVSSYPLLPDDSDQDGGLPSTAFGTDWCKWEDPARISCKGSFETLSDQDGRYSVDLIPGGYDVFISPRDSEPTSRGLIVTKHDGDDPSMPAFLVSERSASGSVLFEAQRGTSFTGTVYASNTVSPKVTLRASRRPTPPFSSWGTVADYNRSLSTVSDRKGHFSITPDIGYYDFIFEPEHDSYFAWKLWLDCPNGPETGGALSAVRLSAPVMVFGSVESEDTGSKLAAAKIEAFTIVYSERNAPRSVMIGRTFSNANGDYSLALPPEVGEQTRSNCEGYARLVTGSERVRR